MGALIKLIDAILFLFYIVIALVVPIVDSQTVLPLKYYPESFIELNQWYQREYGDYLLAEKPHFFVGLIWLDILVLWPLSIANLYGFIVGKSWFNTTRLIFGVSYSTFMVPILADMLGSGRASKKLLMVNFPFLGCAILTILRGLLPQSAESTTMKTKKRV